MASGHRIDSIDGLRAVSVAAVIAYHLELAQFGGGFVGVEVFFVISGFLITGLLLHEHDRSGRLDLRRFWVRRFRRLLPAVIALLLFVLVCIPFFAPDAADTFPRDAGGALLYASNWWQVLFGQSYFEAALRPPLLRHLWSLAVEEQFYVVWPLVMVGLVRVRRVTAGFMVGVGAAASAALMWFVHEPSADSTRAYIGTDTRAFGLLLGASLAFMVSAIPRLTSGRRTTAWFGFCAVAVLGWAMWSLSADSGWLFPLGFLLVDAATLVALVAASSPGAAPFQRLLGAPPLRWLGTRSYGLYLFHWPVFQMMRPRVDLDGWWVNPLRVGISLALAELSYRVVEGPIREHGVRGVGRRVAALMGRRLSIGTASLAGLVALAAAVNVAVLADQPVEDRSAAADLIAEVSGSDSGLPDGQSGSTTGKEGKEGKDGKDGTNAGSSGSDATATTVIDATTLSSLGSLGAGPASPSTSSVTTTTIAPEAGTVLTIGDSVMLGATARLRRAFGQQVIVDAEESRSWFKAQEELDRFATSANPPRVLFVHLGNNGAPEVATLKRVVDSTRNIGTVVFVTVSVPRRYEATANERIRSAIKLRPDLRIADWAAYSGSNRSWFARDGFHLSQEGAVAFADLLRNTVSDVVPSVPASSPASASPTTSTSTTTTTTTTSTLPPPTVRSTVTTTRPITVRTTVVRPSQTTAAPATATPATAAPATLPQTTALPPTGPALTAPPSQPSGSVQIELPTSIVSAPQ